MQENSKMHKMEHAGRWTWLPLLTAVSVVFVYFFGLTIPLIGPDEPRYAQVAREMYERSDWITPTLGGYTWFEKPALLYWLQIVSYEIFGVSEFAARFSSALFGIGTIFTVWLLARSVRCSDTSHARSSTEFAGWVALIAASSIGMLVFSRGATFDIILTFPITASLAGFLIYDQDRDTRRRYLGLTAFYFFIGVSLLAKGLVGIVFPFAIVGLYYVVSLRMPRRTLLISLIWGVPLLAAVAAVWYVPMYLANGYKFIDEFFIQHHFQRFTSNKYLHPQPFYFFFLVLPLMTIPWLPFFLAALWKYVQSFRRNLLSRAQTAENRDAGCQSMLKFALVWLIVPVVFFSFSGSKLPGYVMPALPGAVLLTADFIFEYVRNRPRRAFLLRGIAAATLAVTVLLLIFVVPRFAEGDSVKSLVEAADLKGFGSAKVVCMHAVSYNAEFYAAGRLLRETNGTLKKLLGPAEVRDESRKLNGATILVLVPVEYLNQFDNADYLNWQFIKDNGETAIVAAAARDFQPLAARRSLSVNAAPIPFGATASQ